MLGAISIRLRQARLERERETHTHTHTEEGEGRRRGGKQGRLRGCTCTPRSLLPGPAGSPHRPQPRGVARWGDAGRRGAAGWPAAPRPGCGSLCRALPAAVLFCRRRPSNRSQPREMAAQTCPLHPAFGGSPGPLPSHPLLQSRVLLSPGRTCPAYLPFTLFFFFNSQFLFSSLSERTSPVPGMAPPQSQQALGSKNPDLNVNIGQVCPRWKSLEAGHTELRALKK